MIITAYVEYGALFSISFLKNAAKVLWAEMTIPIFSLVNPVFASKI